MAGSSLQNSRVDHEDRRWNCELQQGDPSFCSPSSVFAIDANPFKAESQVPDGPKCQHSRSKLSIVGITIMN